MKSDNKLYNEIDRLREINAELLNLLKSAIARVELANAEGDNILSAWLPDARAAIRAAEGEGKS